MMESEMAHNVTIDANRPAAASGRGKLILIAALAGAVALFSLVDIRTPTQTQTPDAVSAGEDWHGNVRRSNWPN